MNIRNDIRRIDHKMHRLEHSLALSSERLIHQEAFWPIFVVAIMLLGLILLSHFAGNIAPPRMYEGPLGPLY